MSEKSNADKAGPATPEKSQVDPIGGFKRDDLRLKAIESQHQTQQVIARTNAQASVRRAAITAFMIALVLLYAMVLGKPVLWPAALAAWVVKLLG